MNPDVEDKIKAFLSGAPRYRIVVDTTKKVDELYVDVGAELSQFLSVNKNISPSNLKFAVADERARLFRENKESHPDLGDFLRICNLGILFEPKLGIDIRQVLQNFSRNTLTIIHWQGDYDDNHLYFLSKEDGITIDLSNTNHIFI